MWLLFFCASLAVIQSALSDSGASLVVALSALCSGILAELLITQRKYGFEKIKDGSAAASAMVLTLLLPNQIHPLYAALGAVFALVVVKYSFGGLGSNWINPALGGWLFIRFSWPSPFAKALEGSPVSFIAGTLETGSAESGIDAAIRSFLNQTVFPLFGAELPAGYIDLLVPKAPGIIADRGLFALLIGTIVIMAFRICRSWVPALYLVVFGLLVRFAGDLPSGYMFWNGDVLFGLCTGGTIAAAFMLITEPSSSAKSGIGIAAAAILGAVLSWLFRYQGSEFYGCFFALTLVNALTPVIHYIERRCLYSQRAMQKPAIHAGGIR
jgi:electron transport complex protein RnfD